MKNNQEKDRNDSLTVLTVGNRRRARGGLEQARDFFLLVRDLRGKRKFIPRGVYRFRTFEEAEQWSVKMMARR